MQWPTSAKNITVLYCSALYCVLYCTLLYCTIHHQTQQWPTSAKTITGESCQTPRLRNTQHRRARYLNLYTYTLNIVKFTNNLYISLLLSVLVNQIFSPFVAKMWNFQQFFTLYCGTANYWWLFIFRAMQNCRIACVQRLSIVSLCITNVAFSQPVSVLQLVCYSLQSL